MVLDDPHIERPLVNLHEPAVRFYALDGESVVSFPEDQTKERICECLEQIREQNPRSGILLVLDNYFAHTFEYTRKRVHQIGIDLVFLPVGSPDLSPIDQVWKQLKWEASTLIVKNLFEDLTSRLSFARSWRGNFLSNLLQFLS